MAIEKTTDILVSDELREILKQIETQSLVANLLLRGRHTSDTLVDNPINFISVGKNDKSKISYLSHDRIEALKEDDNPWGTTKRYMSKPGSFVAKIFKNISSKETEVFSSLFQSITTKKPMRFEIVKGDDIKYYYYYNSYDNGGGSLGASCMKHEHCQKYFSLYTSNPEMISMLIMLNEHDLLIGRALLWNFDGHKIMDRIYTQNDEKLSFYFKQWATDNDYLYKSEQNWFNTLFFENMKSEKKELRFDIKIPNFEHSRYPYMDTFKFYDHTTGTFSNYLANNNGNVTTLTSSDGGQNSCDHLVFDDISRVYRYRNDAAYLNYRDVWTSRQNAQFSNYNDTWILNEDAVYNEYIGDYIFNEANYSLNKPRVLEIIEKVKKEREEMKKSISNRSKTKRVIFDEPWSDYVSDRFTSTNIDYDADTGVNVPHNDNSLEESSESSTNENSEYVERDGQDYDRAERPVYRSRRYMSRPGYLSSTFNLRYQEMLNDMAYARDFFRRDLRPESNTNEQSATLTNSEPIDSDN